MPEGDRHADNGPPVSLDWNEFLARIRGAAQASLATDGSRADSAAERPAVDDVIDQVIALLHQSSPALEDPRAVPSLLGALAVARSRSTKRDLASLLASAPGSAEGAAVVDALADAFNQARSDALLGPDLLDALGMLAERSPLAATTASNVLLRLSPDAERYLLIRAAKVIGRLESLGVTTHAQALLVQLAESTDLAVEAEARQQLAILALAEALRQPDIPSLRAKLSRARRALVKAELSEEQRLDARQLLAFVDLVEIYLDSSAARDSNSMTALAAALTHHAGQLKVQIANPAARPWYGYASPSESVIEWRLYRIALGFERLAEVLGTAEEWTNFDEALVDVAAAFELMVSPPTRGLPSQPAIERYLRGALVGYTAPVGPLIKRVVGRTRLAKVLEHLEASGGKDETVRLLREVHDAVCAAERSETPAALPSMLGRAALRRLVADQPFVIPYLVEAIPGVSEELREMGIEVMSPRDALATMEPFVLLPVDAPDCYGNDPAVDDTVRRILAGAAMRLGPGFGGAAWQQFTSVAASVIRLARDIRNDLPPFARSKDDDGMGQSADEGDLQQYLFEHLRREYGRGAIYEAGPNSGGRTDSGVHLSNIEIPIEVKAEYHRADPEHIRGNYLGQADQYATNRDGVAFLLILDLRAGHANRHRSRQRTGVTPIKLYSLRESFYVDGHAVDPSIPNSRTNAVVIGLVPGNQVRPSSMTRYSRRPRKRTAG